MDKVYLLLRKNQQTGPYTYEELLQQQLLPTDLIWVEGKSTAWIDPAELARLHTEGAKPKAASPEAAAGAGRPAAVQNTRQEAPWYLNRKSPEAELEERALALRERAQAAAAHRASHPSASTVPKHHRPRTVYQEAEQPLVLEVHTLNKKSVTLPQLMAAGVITALVATGWYNREVLHIVRPQQNTVTQAAAPAVFQVSQPTPPPPRVVAVTDTAAAQPRDTVAAALAVARMPASPPKAGKGKAAAAKAAATDSAESAPLLAQTTPAEKKEATATDTAVARKAPEKQDTAAAVVAQAPEAAAVEQAAPHKKKGLGQALKNIFKKKKKNDDKAGDESSDTE